MGNIHQAHKGDVLSIPVIKIAAGIGILIIENIAFNSGELIPNGWPFAIFIMSAF